MSTTTAAGSYFYKVTAEDAAGNIGSSSNEAAATVSADTSAPSAPSGLTAPVSGSTANLAWSAATDNVGVVRYNVHRGTSSGFVPAAGNRIAQPTATSYADSGLAIGNYFYKVTAEDAAGNISAASNEAAVTIADATPPSAPSNLAATATGSTVNLTWTAGTDNIGVSRYNLHRGTTSSFTPSSANRIAQPTATSYSDTNLAAGTYFYKLTAEDAAGNISTPSNTASATVADTTPPSTPTLSATGAAGQANLSWTAATDNIAVSRYNLHRSTTSGFTPTTSNRIAQPTATSYSDTNLAAATYYYKLTAEDAAGNISAPSNQATATVTAPPVTGLVAAYGFDEATGPTATDSSGNGNNGSISGATWAIGKFGTALSFDGVNDVVNVVDSASLDLTTGMTIEAWVLQRATGTTWRTVAIKEQVGNYAYGLYANTGTSRPSANVVSGGVDRDLRGPASLPLDTWVHATATYDAATLRLYVDGALVASVAATGSISTSTGALRIGGNTIWGEYFQGLIDEVRIYNRALSASEIQSDMVVGAATDTRDPTVIARTPAPGTTSLPIDTQPTATFSEAMNPATLSPTTFEVVDSLGGAVPGTVTYDPIMAKATFVPDTGLIYANTYTARVRSGAAGVKDMSGRNLAADVTWTFSIEAVPPPVAVLTDPGNPFTTYLQEVLRAEGITFATFPASALSPTVLSFYDVIVLGEVSLTATQVTALTNWVAGGGNLIAMRPDKKLAGLMGLTDAGTTLANAYLKTACCAQAAAGITAQSIQYHGTADRYTLNGATVLATLYSNATTATTNPAVTLRDVGTVAAKQSRSHMTLRGRSFTPGRAIRRGLARSATVFSAFDPTTSSTARRRATFSLTGSTSTRSESPRPMSNSGCSRT